MVLMVNGVDGVGGVDGVDGVDVDADDVVLLMLMMMVLLMVLMVLMMLMMLYSLCWYYYCGAIIVPVCVANVNIIVGVNVYFVCTIYVDHSRQTKCRFAIQPFS